MEDPIGKFDKWWQEALVNSPLQQKSAVCVSTIDEKGFPAARFVDLKLANDAGFVFCTYFDSAKGRQITSDPKTALTIWWDHIGYQVRIVGMAEVISDKEAERFWGTRSRSAQLTTTAFEQSEPMTDDAELMAQLQIASEKFTDQQIPKPNNWGGYRINPISIEFLRFQKNRLHLREFFERNENVWAKTILQP